MDKENIIEVLDEFLTKYFTSIKEKSVIKAVDEELKQATHVVYEPNVPDLHNEWMSEETVRKACHSFNLHCQKANLFHRIETDKIDVVESYILPVDTMIGDRAVSKGTWIAVLQYKDADLWEMEKSNEIQGVSIGARGNKVDD